MKFSVITVVKNDKYKILKTINSVKSQKFKDFEYIVVDGKSTDGTSQIIKKNLRKNKYNKHIIKKDKNLYQALNYGIKISKGEYIVILHSGDLFYNNNTLNKMSENIKKIDAISGNILYKKGNKVVRFWNYKIKKLNKFSAFKVAHTSLVVKRLIVEQIKGYDSQYNISSDTDFILKLSLVKKLRFKYLNEIFVIMESGGLSNSYKNSITKIFQDFKIYKKFFNKSFIFFYLLKLNYKLLKLLQWKLFKC